MAICYWCDDEAAVWADWVIHEVPGVYGGGCLVSVVPICQAHAELIADVDSVISSTVEFS